MSVELETEINVKEKIKEVIQDPGKYKVIFANDNETPMDFVVEVLMKIMRWPVERAMQSMMEAHQSGLNVWQHGNFSQSRNPIILNFCG